jgi:hypothetical protein
MNPKHKFTIEEAREIGAQPGVDLSVFDFAEFRRKLEIELEHGLSVPESHNDAPLTGKIARAHHQEFPDHYTRWTGWKPRRMGSRQRKG